MPPRSAAVGLAAAFFARGARGSLELSAFSNGVFGAPAAVSLVPDVALPAFNTSARRSFVFSGTLTPPATEALAFSARASGVLRVYVDDHLVLDDAGPGCARDVAGWDAWPAAAGVGAPLRVEFTHDDATCAAPLLELSWAGSVTARERVPAAALAPPPAAGARADFAALRARLYEPAVPWQTYYAPSMCVYF